MSSIREIARITKSGRVTSTKTLAEVVTTAPEVVVPFVIRCAALVGDTACPNPVSKAGSFCSWACYAAIMTPHEAPCGEAYCIDVECAATAGIIEHLAWNVSQDDKPRWMAAALKGLANLLNNSEYAAESPEFFIEAALEYATHTWKETHVQEEKPVLTATTKAIRKPSTAKHTPRTTDGQEHPVVVTPQAQEATMTDNDTTITLTKAQMERAITEATDRLVAERLATITLGKAAKAEKAKRPVLAREGVGVVLPAIVVDQNLTVDAINLGDVTLDSVVPATLRSIYNKARFRVTGEPVLPKDVTYRALVLVHESLLARVANKAGKVESVPAQALVVASTTPVVSNKTHVWKGKEVTAKQYAHYLTLANGRVPEGSGPIAVAADVDVQASAKPDKAKVRALMTVLGVSKKEAKALLAKV